MKTIPIIAAVIPLLSNFINQSQLRVMVDNCHGEEGVWFIEKLCSLAKTIETMPHQYQQDGKGDSAIAYLRYFHRAGGEWHITERDSSPEQLQAFGLCDLGWGPELGCVSIQELIDNNAELDLHFEPKTLAEIKKN